MEYKTPIAEILARSDRDVITTSGLTVANEGRGDFRNFQDIVFKEVQAL